MSHPKTAHRPRSELLHLALAEFADTLEALPIDVVRSLLPLYEVSSKLSLLPLPLSSAIDAYLSDPPPNTALLKQTLATFVPVIDENVQLASTLASKLDLHISRLQHNYSILDAQISGRDPAPTSETVRTVKPPSRPSDSASTPRVKRIRRSASPPDTHDEEMVYCYCNQVSFGEMVACDDPNCSREWFHLSCLQLDSLPQGKWYCKDCKANNTGKKRRNGVGTIARRS